jgi:regulatory protein YycI of two-component signal transduction system YycFG
VPRGTKQENEMEFIFIIAVIVAFIFITGKLMEKHVQKNWMELVRQLLPPAMQAEVIEEMMLMTPEQRAAALRHFAQIERLTKKNIATFEAERKTGE